jgi:hypothetical protein
MTGLKHCDKFRNNLIFNLKKCIGFVEEKDLYVHAAVLTAKYGKRWLKPSEQEDFNKARLVRAVENHIAKHPLKIKQNVDNNSNKENSINMIKPPAAKRLKMMSYLYENENDENTMSDKLSISKQIDS